MLTDIGLPVGTYARAREERSFRIANPYHRGLKADSQNQPQPQALIRAKVQVANFCGTESISLNRKDIFPGLQEDEVESAIAAGRQLAR